MSDQPSLLDVTPDTLKPIDRKARRIADNYIITCRYTYPMAIRAIQKDIERWKAQFDLQSAAWHAAPVGQKPGFEEPKYPERNITILEQAIDILRREAPIS